MPIRISLSDTVCIRVEGKFNDAAGPAVFDFNLIARRLNTEELRDRLAEHGEEPVVEFLASVVTGWQHVKDEAGVAEFSPQALRQLLQIHGLPVLCLREYVAGCGAQAKN